eukprot:scaffold38661_cov34-Tisochrysis_lutea.AAC.4
MPQRVPRGVHLRRQPGELARSIFPWLSCAAHRPSKQIAISRVGVELVGPQASHHGHPPCSCESRFRAVPAARTYDAVPATISCHWHAKRWDFVFPLPPQVRMARRCPGAQIPCGVIAHHFKKQARLDSLVTPLATLARRPHRLPW